MSKASSQEAILTYLEEKYDERFEVEAFDEGNEALKQMYGGDELIAHPEGNPEHVFLAGEDRDHEGEYYDNYVLSIWQNELTKHYKEEISKILTGLDYEYRILIYSQDGYNGSNKGMSVFEYLSNNKQDASIALKLAIKESSDPNINNYKGQIYELYKLVNNIDAESSRVSIGVVEKSTGVKDYIRTSEVNNVPWSNMIGKVYGTLTIHKQFEITDPSQIEEYYRPMEE
ncbi:hypothetical protein [Aquibacillus kalidii]|uniref:hypothetical protein n=1 Tax=Aquibacillus kalidii TaxID=2762597 RepID=UPI0016492715|nr:hypothetical protein [Aquibacillus kalidii]